MGMYRQACVQFCGNVCALLQSMLKLNVSAGGLDWSETIRQRGKGHIGRVSRAAHARHHELVLCKRHTSALASIATSHVCAAV